jgi:hypothetical protein
MVRSVHEVARYTKIHIKYNVLISGKLRYPAILWSQRYLILQLLLYHNEKHRSCINASKEVGLEVNVEKTKYMFMSHHQTTKQNYYIKVANKSFENVAKFKYLGMKLTNQNYIHEKIKS